MALDIALIMQEMRHLKYRMSRQHHLSGLHGRRDRGHSSCSRSSEPPMHTKSDATSSPMAAGVRGLLGIKGVVRTATDPVSLN